MAKRRKQSALRDQNTNLVNEIDREMVQFEAAFSFSYEGMNQGKNLTLLQQDARVLKKAGCPLWVPGKLLLVTVCIADLIAQGLYEQVVKCLRPWMVMLEGKNSFDCTLPMICRVADEATPEEIKDIAKCITGVFFCNSTSNLFKEPHESEYPEEYYLCLAVLEGYEHFPAEDPSLYKLLTDDVVQAFDDVMKACRAVLTVYNPTPGIYGATYRDAFDLFSEASDYVMSQGLANFATSAMKCKRFANAVHSYFHLGSNDDTYADLYQAHCTLLHSMDSGSPVEILKSATEILKIADDLISWEGKIRPGGCDVLGNSLGSLVKHVWHKETEPDAEEPQRQFLLSLTQKIRNTSVPADATLDTIAACLATQTKAVAQKSALLQCNKALAEWRGDFDFLHEVATPALEACHGLKLLKESEVTVAVSFRSLLAVTIQIASASANDVSQCASFERNFKTVQHVYSLLLAMLPSTERGDESKLMIKFLRVVQASVRIKRAKSELAVDILEDHDETKRLISTLLIYDLVADYTLVKKELDDAMVLATDAATFNEVTRTQHAHMSSVVVATNDEINTQAKLLKDSLVLGLTKAKARLDKVASGTSNAKSWKEGVKVDATMDDEELKTALKVLKDAFVDAINKRVLECKEVLFII
jgi:hypothetical protein